MGPGGILTQCAVLCRAYDMAAIALKGMEKATTNFPKDRYLHEPFMQERAAPCRLTLCMCCATATLRAHTYGAQSMTRSRRRADALDDHQCSPA